MSNNKLLIVIVTFTTVSLILFSRHEMFEHLYSNKNVDTDLLNYRNKFISVNKIKNIDLDNMIWSDKISYKSGKYGTPVYKFKFLFKEDFVISATYKISSERDLILESALYRQITFLEYSEGRLKGARYDKHKILDDLELKEFLLLATREHDSQNPMRITKNILDKL